MASIEDLSTEIGFRVAVYIVPSQVEILSKVSKRFNANWSFFNDFASCMVYLKNHGYLTVTNIFFQLHSATLLAARIVMDDYKTYSLYHCSKDVCCYRLKGDRRDLGTPCIRHSRKMAEALRIAVANGFPDELLRSIPKILIHNNLLHTMWKRGPNQSIYDMVADLPELTKANLSLNASECMLEAVTWNNVEDMVFLFAVGNLEEKIPEMVGRAVSLGQVEVLHALFELDAMNPETAERVYTINMVNGDDMMDLALTHPKLTLGVILMHSLSKRTDELYERVFNALVHQGNILQLQSMLEWFIPKDCFIDYTSTVKMLNFVTTLPSVKIDTHTFVLQCCKKINIPVLLDFGKRRPDKLANIVSSILQSPNSDTIILDQRIPVSWREALVRHSLKLPSCLVSRRLGRALDSVIQAGGLNISEDEKKHACFVCVLSNERAVFDEAKNRALCRAFERCDVKAVFSLLTDPNVDPMALADRKVFLKATRTNTFSVLYFLLRSWPGKREGFSMLFQQLTGTTHERCELRDDTNNAKALNDTTIDILERLIFLRDYVFGYDITGTDLKYLLRSMVQKEKFARMFRNALDLGWIGVSSLFLGTCSPRMLHYALNACRGLEEAAFIADLLTYTLIDVKPEILAVIIGHVRAVEWVCDHHLEMPVSNEVIMSMMKGVKKSNPWMVKARGGNLKLQSWMSFRAESSVSKDLGVGKEKQVEGFHRGHATAAGYASYTAPTAPNSSSDYQGRQGWSLPDVGFNRTSSTVALKNSSVVPTREKAEVEVVVHKPVETPYTLCVCATGYGPTGTCAEAAEPYLIPQGKRNMSGRYGLFDDDSDDESEDETSYTLTTVSPADVSSECDLDEERAYTLQCDVDEERAYTLECDTDNERAYTSEFDLDEEMAWKSCSIL